jgi:hypothetical protein
MNKILISLNIIVATLIGLQGTTAFATDKPEIKKACVKDQKTGKETCKDIKVHKKLEGTQVPEKKK